MVEMWTGGLPNWNSGYILRNRAQKSFKLYIGQKYSGLEILQVRLVLRSNYNFVYREVTFMQLQAAWKFPVLSSLYLPFLILFFIPFLFLFVS